jgi:hypothetical protein
MLYTRSVDTRHASASLSKWGLIQGWLAGNAARRVELRASTSGLMFTVIDPAKGERSADVGTDEEASSAVWRTIVLLDRGH